MYTVKHLNKISINVIFITVYTYNRIFNSFYVFLPEISESPIRVRNSYWTMFSKTFFKQVYILAFSSLIAFFKTSSFSGESFCSDFTPLMKVGTDVRK